MNKRDLVQIRPGIKTDEPLIYSSWLNGLRYANDWFHQIEQDTYFSNYHRVIENILARPNTYVNVACLVEDPDVVLGYAVLEPQVLHWVFTKPAWRNIGLCKDMVPEDTHTTTHLTKVGFKIKPLNMVFNPFL